MEEFWFYVKLGYNHVIDPGAYDHVLFLCALAIPFTFAGWKKLLLLATIFTVAHCISLGMSAYDILQFDAGLIEFLIPITIVLTAIFNIFFAIANSSSFKLYLHVLATAFFGGIHGFGFSNYFNMLMAEEENKTGPLLGFASGIEIAQLLILLILLLFTSRLPAYLRVKHSYFVITCSLIVVVITIPLLIKSLP